MTLCLAGITMACRQETPVREIGRYPVDNMENVLTLNNVSFDANDSSDGKGSIRIDAAGPAVFRLYEMKIEGVDDARLTYRAKVKVKDLVGKAYLEMWCVFPGGGEYFSRGLASPVTGTTGWITQEIPFFLKKDQKPEMLRLNIVVDGKGTVWVDDISVTKGPLR